MIEHVHDAAVPSDPPLRHAHDLGYMAHLHEGTTYQMSQRVVPDTDTLVRKAIPDQRTAWAMEAGIMAAMGLAMGMGFALVYVILDLVLTLLTGNG